MALTNRELIGNIDAVTWAEEWCEIAREIAEDKDEREVIDEGWMIGWFANAIMAGFDQGYNQQRRDIARLKYALNHWWNRAQYEYACEKELWEDDDLAEILPSVRPERQHEIGQVPVKVPLGDPTEYELVSTPGADPFGIGVVRPAQHEYADEDVARLAQQVEALHDVLGDMLLNTYTCEYDEEEFCHIHGLGRPCAFEIARSYIC